MACSDLAEPPHQGSVDALGPRSRFRRPDFVPRQRHFRRDQEASTPTGGVRRGVGEGAQMVLDIIRRYRTLEHRKAHETAPGNRHQPRAPSIQAFRLSNTVSPLSTARAGSAAHPAIEAS